MSALEPEAADTETEETEEEENLEFPTQLITTESRESGPVEYRWPHPSSSDHT